MKNILFAASECVPFVKTGGLADVVGALPLALDRSRFDVRVILPAYIMIPECYRSRMQTVVSFYSYFNGRDRYVGVKQLELRGITFYFLDNEEYFGGSSPYTEYSYDIEKFAFFSKAVLSVLPSLGFRPDLIHCNDWHTGLIPVYLKTEFSGSDYYRGIKTVMTIHNLKFQGPYNAGELEKITGISAAVFSDAARFGEGNYLKSGILFADAVNTVSPSYAEEIKTPDFGEGLDWIFRNKSEDFCGILNGIDTETYQPASDAAIPFPFTPENFRTVKKKNKAALQRELGLEEDPKAMLIGLVSRLTEQKGLDLIEQKLPQLTELPIQLAVLGTGEQRYEEMFRRASAAFPGRIAASFCYSEDLAHRIYAGSDAYLMPSRFEPCGLSQLIALRYGTVPIVREIGGLKDTVIPYNRFTGEGTGFSFWNYNGDAMMEVLTMALDLYRNKKRNWNLLAEHAIRCDFSWTRSAAVYSELYCRLIGC